MSVDNRTEINDCNSATGWVGDGSPALNTLTGQRYEGSGSIEAQHTNADEEAYTTEDSLNTGTFSLDWSDSTIYMLVKDNLVDTFANGGVQFIIGDGTDRIGYDVGGNDAVGMPLTPFYNAYKLDVSNRPGSFTVQAGVEANLTTTAITQVGYGSLHLAKAQGNVPNVFLDYFSYISNGSYALTINGGTSGTPETMADVSGDDVTNGWGLVSNPIGKQYLFFAPTEWGEASASADHYFTASDEQWFWLGDNSGGHAVGATHFPFRLVSNATDTGSFVITRVTIVNTGTRAQLLMDDANFNIIELDGCSITGTGTISLPSAGGTSRFTTNCTFINCDQITNNGADMTGSNVFNSNVAANAGALLYNETTDPDGELDDLTFTQGTTAHHAIEFGTNIPTSVTLRGCDFSGFSSSNDNDGSVFKFLDTTGNFTLNLVNCTNDGSGFTVDDRAGCTVTVVVDPVTALVNVKDENNANLQNARVYLKASDGTGPLPYQDSVTITRSGTEATVSHTAHGMETNDRVVIKGITDKTEDNAGTHVITVTGPNAYTYVTTDSGSTNYTGSITSTWVAIDALTDASGNASRTKSYASDQPVDGWVRKSSPGSTRYKSFPILGTIDSVDGFTVNVKMVKDQ